MTRLPKVAPPALPVAPREYSPGATGQLLNVLRIFFDAAAQRLNSIMGSYGGRFIEVPAAEFYDTTEQTAAAVNTAQPVTFDSTRTARGLSLNGVDNSEVTATFAGVYSVDFHAQLESHSVSAKTVMVWASVDGVPVPDSAKMYTLAGSGEAMEVTWTALVELQAGGYLQIEWVTNDADVDLHATAATPPHPGAPSAVLSIFLVSSTP